MLRGIAIDQITRRWEFRESLPPSPVVAGGKGIADLEGSEPAPCWPVAFRNEKGVIAESGKGPCALRSISTPFAYARKWSRCLLALFVPRIDAMRSYVTENKM